MDQMLFPNNGFEIQSIGNIEKPFARKTGYSPALTFDSDFSLCTVNNIKNGFGRISLISVDSFNFMEILGGKYNLKSECGKEHLPQKIFLKSLKGLFPKGDLIWNSLGSNPPDQPWFPGMWRFWPDGSKQETWKF